MTSKPFLSVMAAALVLCSGAPLLAQSSRISGVVRDETGSPIRGAIVTGEMQGVAMTLTSATDTAAVSFSSSRGPATGF
jgi:hypothetical protein